MLVSDDFTNNIKWDRRFLELATVVAEWSKDPSTRVGAVIVRPNRAVASVGYNGFPRGVSDEYRTDPGARDDKLLRTVHAEANAIMSADRDLDGHTLYSTFCPCAGCAALVIQSGIKRVVWFLSSPRPEWAASFATSADMFTMAGVSTHGYAARPLTSRGNDVPQDR